MSAPGDADILAAAQRLAGRAVRTPLLAAPALDAATGARVLIKPESLQRTGSFKFRGAYNFIAALDPDVRARGVVAYSSGNHGRAVAAVAALFAVPSVIVMPSDAPAVKIESTRRHGARLLLYDRARESREPIAAAVAAETGATLVPPFEHPMIIAGQGTIGLEIAADLGDAALDVVLVPCSGGGLAAGIATALAAAKPEAAIYTVEPVGFDDTARSLAGGARQRSVSEARSFADALLVPMPGELTFSINRRLLAGGLAVSDDDIAAAMVAAFRHLKLVLEPGGAAALAALLGKRIAVEGRTVAVVCSGGNVDEAVFAEVLRTGRAPPQG